MQRLNHVSSSAIQIPVVADSPVRPSLVCNSPWIVSAHFVVGWLFPFAMGIYLKWYILADQGGFVRVARSTGVATLSIFDRLSFFRTDLIIGAIAIPFALLVVNRYLSSRWAAAFTSATGVTFIALIGIQAFALTEVGRFSSLRMMLVGLAWGWHEPGAGFQYLASRETLIPALSLLGTGAATFWAVKVSDHASPKQLRSNWKMAGEVYLFVVVSLILLSFKSDALVGPYHESSFVRSITSLWRENAVETGEFRSLDFRGDEGPPAPDFASLSPNDLITRYRQLTHSVLAPPDSRFFGKEKGANVLFLILETTPEKYLPVDADMGEFPNMERLRAHSFVGTRHYTTFPNTRDAVFSIFSSWYPIDDSQDAFDAPRWDGDDFLRRLESEGYRTAVFSPLRAAAVPDEELFRAVGFERQFYPSAAIATYDQRPSWKEARVEADIETLHILESHIDEWTAQGQHFVAAFLPQIAHSPYPDSSNDNTAEGLQQRGRAILATEDGWVGEILALLQKRHQLDNTIIVIVGDHGLRAIMENPNLRRGTIDENAFHVPLLIYAPRALDHSERIDQLTSHVDIVPTVLDMLGEKGHRDSEQGAAIWNSALADRTTYFFAKPMFGADGYASGGREFYMWHYFSDSVYAKATPEFVPSDIIPRKSVVARDVTSNILAMRSLEKAWHAKFADPTAKRDGYDSKVSAAR
jgi:sulfatase-like protein